MKLENLYFHPLPMWYNLFRFYLKILYILRLILPLDAWIYGMGIYAIMLPSSGFSVAHWLMGCWLQLYHLSLETRAHRHKTI